jgi:hypothetical protein
MKQEIQNKIHKLLLDSAMIDYTNKDEVEAFIASLNQFNKLELLGVYTSNRIIDSIVASKPVYLLTEKDNNMEQTFVDSNDRANFTMMPAQSRSENTLPVQGELFYLNIFGALQKMKYERVANQNLYDKGIDKCLKLLNYVEEKDKIVSIKNRFNSYSFTFKGAKNLFEKMDIEQLDNSVKNDWHLYRIGSNYSIHDNEIQKLKNNMNVEFFNLEQGLKIIHVIDVSSREFHHKVENIYHFKEHFKKVFENENSVVQFSKLFFKNVARYDINSFISPSAFKSHIVQIKDTFDEVNITYTKKFIEFLNVNFKENSHHQIKNFFINTFPTNQIRALIQENILSLSWGDLVKKNSLEILHASDDISQLLSSLDIKEPLFLYAQNNNIDKKVLFASLITSVIKEDDLHMIIKNNLNYLSKEDFNFHLNEKEHSAYNLLKNNHYATFDELMRVGFDLNLVNREGKNLMAQLQSKKKYQPFSIILEQYMLENSVLDNQDSKKRIKI